MGIVRCELSFEGNFAQIPNSLLRDKTLSLKARGILFELMSHRLGWNSTMESLVSDKDGLASVKSGLTELKNAGWLEIRRLRGDDGKVSGFDYVLTDPCRSEPEVENPLVENPLVENPLVENRTLKNTIPKEDYSKNIHPDACVLDVDDGAGQNIDSASSPSARRRSVPLPDDWSPTDKHRLKAEALGVDVEATAQQMRKWAFAGDRTSKSWNMTFNNFLANAKPTSRSKIGGRAELARLVEANDREGVFALVGERWRPPRDVQFLDDPKERAEKETALFRLWASEKAEGM